jgi:hypothetical protein
MNFFRRKMIKCKTCPMKVPEKKAWKIEMRTAEGNHTIQVCEQCAKLLENVKESYDELRK